MRTRLNVTAHVLYITTYVIKQLKECRKSAGCWQQDTVRFAPRAWIPVQTLFGLLWRFVTLSVYCTVKRKGNVTLLQARCGPEGG
jgi:hypothetical protein